MRPLARRHPAAPWGHSSITCDQENPATLLGDSEILSIKHSPASHIPAVRKGPDDDLKVFAIVDREQVNDILKHHPPGLNFLDDSYDFPEKAASFAAEPALILVAVPGTGETDVLAGKASCDDIDSGQVVLAALADIFKLGCVRKSIGKDSPVDRIEFNLPGGTETGVFKADIKASNACEQAANR